METPTRVSSPASSSVHCQDSNERDDEISTPDDEEIRSMSADMTRGVDTAISTVNNDLPTVSTECQEEFLKDILSYASSLFPEFSVCYVTCFYRWNKVASFNNYSTSSV